MRLWEAFLYPALQQIANDILDIAPNFLAALILLIVGWIVARIAGGLLRRLLAKIGFNRLAERAGISGLLDSAGFLHDASWLVGRLVFWLLMLMFFLSAAEQLHLSAIVVTLQQLVVFIPNVIAVVVIGVLGALFGRFVGGLVRGAAHEANLAFADLLGRLVNGLILVIVIVTAFMQLEIESGMLEITLSGRDHQIPCAFYREGM